MGISVTQQKKIFKQKFSYIFGTRAQVGLLFANSSSSNAHNSPTGLQEVYSWLEIPTAYIEHQIHIGGIPSFCCGSLCCSNQS